jgi:REP element-mobilizing transposase RayT
MMPENHTRARCEAGFMDQKPYALDEPRRKAVMAAILEVCTHREWVLMAAHVRSTHVHAVIQADAEPEGILHILKAYASRRLNLMGCDEPRRKRWTRHGSTRWLFEREHVNAAVQYVVDEQGEKMSVYEGEPNSKGAATLLE